MGTLNPTHSLTHSLAHSLTHSLTSAVDLNENPFPVSVGKYSQESFHAIQTLAITAELH